MATENKNALAMFEPSAVPAHIADFNETESNIAPRSSADTLTFKGKVWTVTVESNKQVLTKKNDDGDDEPRPIIPVVILDYNKRRGRSYYADGYSSENPSAPACWSKDGIVPDEQVPEKQSPKCATCPKSVKGSKVTEGGRETKACAEHLLVAVQLYNRPDIPPLRLRLPITSIYDARGKDQQDKGWYAFEQYCNLLRARGVKHTASVVTRLKFDPTAEYPKVLFTPVGWLTAEQLAEIKETANSDAVKTLLNPVYAVAAEESPAKVPYEDPDDDGPPKAATAPAKPKAAAAKPAVKPTTVEEQDEDTETVADGEIVDEGGETATDVTGIVADTEADEEDPDDKAARIAAEVAAKAAAKKTAAADKAKAEVDKRKATAAAVVDDDDGEPIKVPPAKTPAKAAAAPASAAGATPGKVTAGKVAAAPKGTPAAAPKPVSAAVGAIIDEW